MGRIRLLLGISVFWLGLGMLSDGLTILVLPQHLLGLVDSSAKATILGIITFLGLLSGMFVQPVAGFLSDRLRPDWGRRGILMLGVFLILAALSFFALTRSVLSILFAYLAIQIAANSAQAAQQGFIPDMVPKRLRGMAAGVRNFMLLGGIILGFLVLGHLLHAGRVDAALLAIAAVIIATFLMTTVLVQERPILAITDSKSATWLDAFHLDWHQHRLFAWLIVSRFLFLLGIFMVVRFMLFFLADRLSLVPARAAGQAGAFGVSLVLLAVATTLIAGWAADRYGRVPLMLVGVAFSAVGVLFMVSAESARQILLFGVPIAVGTAAFTSANWAMTADLAPRSEAARFFGLANCGTVGAAAIAGLFGPLVDGFNRIEPGAGYPALFAMAALVISLSALVLRNLMTEELVPSPQLVTRRER